PSTPAADPARRGVRPRAPVVAVATVQTRDIMPAGISGRVPRILVPREVGVVTGTHSPSSTASARGLKQVAYFDCPGGGQVVVDGRVAFIAHMKAPHGTTLVDVGDPAAPRRLGNRLYVSYWHGGFVILDIEDMARPRLVSGLDWSPPFITPTHTALPVPFPLHGRRVLLVADEDVAKLAPGPPSFLWLVDISEE